jgi:uncharacterized protein with ATP-grasp and redox domains
MNISTECISCIFSQSLRVAQTLRLDDKKTKELLDLSSSFIPKFSLNNNPPVNATEMYEALAQFLQTNDIYKDAKDQAAQKAQTLIPVCKKMIAEAIDPLTVAGKIAIAGNVIDLATKKNFNLDNEIDSILHSDLARDHFSDLNRRMVSAQHLAYFADNAGEHIFDKLYIKTIKECYPKLNIYYFTRGNPIINDVTYEEALRDGLDEYCTIINSGVRTPCIIFDNMATDAYQTLQTCDFIIAKGMGNYECLNDEFSKEIYFLLKVKCEVVASSLNLQIGDLVCLNNKTLKGNI